MAPFVQAGVVNPMGLARYVLQYGFGIKDTSTLLNGPVDQMAQQQQMDPNAQPQGQLPPGMPPQQPDAMPQPADMAGQGPPIEQMPMGQAPQIPPELLAQMGG
jgi:hypothetical protein